ncbi:MAG: ATP synthase F1 subunit delta [Acholeplasmatales bacterium]|nr:ATP synthase F1 subunit delta [Acholeplasmatales bacterium]
MVEAEYAKALSELASTKDAQEILEELDLFIKALDENPMSWQIFDAPNITDKAKKDIIANTTKDFDELITRFLYVLVDNKRINSIKGIRDEFKLIVNNSIKAVDVNVTSKNALTKEQTKKLEAILTSKLDGRKVKINNIVDNNLIGGIKCEYEGKLMDFSVRGKIKNIRGLL